MILASSFDINIWLSKKIYNHFDTWVFFDTTAFYSDVVSVFLPKLIIFNVGSSFNQNRANKSQLNKPRTGYNNYDEDIFHDSLVNSPRVPTKIFAECTIGYDIGFCLRPAGR